MILIVAFGATRMPSSGRMFPELNGLLLPPAWRVGLEDADGQRFIPTSFGRQRDADAAKVALEKAGLTSAESLKTAGRARFEQVMIEALQW